MVEGSVEYIDGLPAVMVGRTWQKVTAGCLSRFIGGSVDRFQPAGSGRSAAGNDLTRYFSHTLIR